MNTATITKSTGADEIVWRNQFAALDTAVAPHVVTMGDGFQYVADSCQPAVARAYRLMMNVGFARGWIS